MPWLHENEARLLRAVALTSFSQEVFDPLTAGPGSSNHDDSASTADRIEPVFRPYQQALTHESRGRLRHVVQFIHVQ